MARAFLPLLLGAAGVVLLAVAAIRGEITVAFVLFVPVIFGSGLAAFAGVALLLGAVVAFLVSLARKEPPSAREPPETAAEEAKRRARGGGVVLLGPVPLVWGTDPRSALAVVLAAIVLLALALLLVSMR